MTWTPPYPYFNEDDEAENPTSPLQFVRECLEWIGRPHGLTSKRCPKDERLREAEDMATVALEALAVFEADQQVGSALGESA